MTHRKPDYAKVSEVQAKYVDYIMDKANVVGVGVGSIPCENDADGDNEMVLVVLVEKKVPLENLEPKDVLPTKLDGVRIDVQETGGFSAGGFEAG